jgi:transcriptional regulator with PAS, ATPase and Fis domain
MQIATRLAKGKEIHPEDFAWVLQEWNEPDDDQSLAAAERRHIAKTLKQHDYHRAQTAKALKLTETTLRSKIRKYGL